MSDHDAEPTVRAHVAPFEDVLVHALDLLEREGASGVEILFAKHPEHATRLRLHLSRLRDLGLLGETPANHGESTDGPAFPERLGDFRLLQRLGGGGMGVVYLAEQMSLGRTVALKLVRSEHLYFPGSRERFRREVEAIAKLQHPGIVPVHTAGEDAGVPWLAMEHIVGASLEAVLRRLEGRDPSALRASDLRSALTAALTVALPRAEAPSANSTHGADSPLFSGTWVSACLRIARGIALALQHAHERGVLHRDVKPSNIMLTLDGRVLLLDFGLAFTDGSARLTNSGSQLGTPAYMSPEQMRGDSHAIDVRSDVYSLGVTLYELLSLRAPFAAESAAAIRELVLAGRLAPLRARNGAVSRDAEIVVRKATDVDRMHRYADADAFAEDLGNLLELRPVQAQQPGAMLVARRWAQRHPAIAVAMLAGVLLFLVTPTVFLLQQQAANAGIRDALDVAKNQEREANAARDAARDQERKATESANLARKQRNLAIEVIRNLLTRVADEQLLEVPRLQRFRRDLLASASNYYERFLVDSGDDPELLKHTARAALDMVFIDGELGRVDAANTEAVHAVDLARQLVSMLPGDTEASLLLAETLLNRGRAQQLQSQLEAALVSLGEAREISLAVLRREPRQARAITHVLGVERGAALVLQTLGRDDEADAAFRALDTMWRERGDATVGDERRHIALDHVICSLADEVKFQLAQRNVEAAKAAVQMLTDIAAANHIDDLPISSRIAMARLAATRSTIAAAEGDPVVQEQCLIECLRIAGEVLAINPEHANALRTEAMAYNGLGILMLGEAARAGEATPWFEKSMQALRHLLSIDPSVFDTQISLAATLVNLGSQYKDAGRPAAAMPLFVEAEQLAIACVNSAPTRSETGQVLYNATWFVGQTSGDLSDVAKQTAAAQRLAQLRPEDGKTQRIAASLVAHAIVGTLADPDLAANDRARRCSELEVMAMAMLHDAAEHGCTDLVYLAEHDDMAPLRGLPGFDAVLQQVAKNVAAAEAADRKGDR